MRIFHKARLKTRILLLVIITGVITLGILSGIFILIEFQDSRRVYEDSQANATVQVACVLGRPSPFTSSADAREILQSLRINPRVIGSALFDKKGHQIAANFPSPPEARPLPLTPSDLKKHPDKPFLRYQNPRNLLAKGNSLGILVPLIQGRETLGWLQVTYSLTPLRTEIMERIRTRVLFGLLGILIATYIFYHYSSRYVHVIDQLKTSTQKISRGDFSVRAPVLDTGDEIAELAATFNQMTSNLQRYTHIEKEAAAHAAAAELESVRAAELEAFQRASLNIMDDLNARSRELNQTLHELRQTQSKLVQAGKMAALGQFGAGVAHELNQALGGIKGFTQLLLSELSPDDRRYQDLKTIEEQTNRMARIVLNIRGFAKGGELEFTAIPITRPLDDAFMLVTAQLNIHNVQTIRDIPANLPLIVGDTQQLQQVFLNLIANALDAIDALPGKPGGVIRVAASVKGDLLEIQFHDTGTGIKAEDLPQIFHPFFSTKPAGTAMGLGLSLAYGIIKAHKGEVWMESEWGKGATFVITLPLAV